jgi:hypothetical protein
MSRHSETDNSDQSLEQTDNSDQSLEQTDNSDQSLEQTEPCKMKDNAELIFEVKP